MKLINTQLCLSLSLGVVIMGGVGCLDGTDTGNASSPVQDQPPSLLEDHLPSSLSTITIALTQDQAPLSSPRFQADDGSEFTFDRATLNIKEVKFYKEQGQDISKSEDEIQEACEELFKESEFDVQCTSGFIAFKSSFEVDLLTGQTQPSLENIQLPTGVYNRIDLRILPQMRDSILFLAGGLDAGPGLQRFQIDLKLSQILTFIPTTSVEIIDQKSIEFALGFDLDRWLGNLPLQSCIERNQIEIEDDTWILTNGRGQCQSLNRSIKDQLEESTHVEVIE